MSEQVHHGEEKARPTGCPVSVSSPFQTSLNPAREWAELPCLRTERLKSAALVVNLSLVVSVVNCSLVRLSGTEPAL